MKAFTLLSFTLFIHIEYKDIPIRKYNATHTGANIQLGGEKSGFAKVEYQVVTDEEVNIDPIIPASWQIIIETTNLTLLSLNWNCILYHNRL